MIIDQLLAMKILAARPEPAKDFIDASILCRDLNIRTIDKIIIQAVILNKFTKRLDNYL